MEQRATIHIDKESHKFSVAHFTVFSATERERLHGHNFSVSARLVASVDDNGLTLDYNVYKDHIRRLCDRLDEYTLIPEQSPHLNIEDDGENWRVRHDQDTLVFLKADTLLIPVANTTVEALSRFLLDTLVRDSGLVESGDVHEIEVFVSSGPGQAGSSTWRPGDTR